MYNRAMLKTRSRFPTVAFGFVAGAAIGLKTVVLLGFVLGVKPSLDVDDKLVFASCWVIAFALVFAALGARTDAFRRTKPAAAAARDV